MTTADFMQLIPDFILGDHNGYALAKALETGMQTCLDVIQSGIDAVQDTDKMPEWRLDEMAWETNCLYDATADVASKRKWIKKATPNYLILGTPAAIHGYLDALFDFVEIEEAGQYEAEPFHFRVTVGGNWSATNRKWLEAAIQYAKNVRSVLDDYAVGSNAGIVISAQTDYIRFSYDMTGTTITGTRPQTNIIARAISGNITLTTQADGHKFSYTLTGTRPRANFVASGADAGITAQAEAEGHQFSYNAAAESMEAGTQPQENTIAKQESASCTAQSEGEGIVFSYPQTSGNTYCGSDGL